MDEDKARALIGQVVVVVTTMSRDNAGVPPEDDEIILRALTLGDGTVLHFDSRGAGYSVVRIGR